MGGGLSAAEKNRRKRERKKRAKEQQQQQQQDEQIALTNKQNNEDIIIEYVPEPIATTTIMNHNDGKTSVSENGSIIINNTTNPNVNDQNTNDTDNNNENDNDNETILEMLRRFHARSAIVVSDDDTTTNDTTTIRTKKEKDPHKNSDDNDNENDHDDDDDDDEPVLSKRKLRELNRPTIAELKNRVDRPDLVEAHDITANDPDTLLLLKSIPGTVPVPQHWGRKRKYLQGKRGIEKAPFQLPDFITKTGITQVRSAVAEDEDKMSAKQKNRGRVAPKMGGLDIDYRTLHDAFFKHQNKATIQSKLTKLGDLYYEGKEFETQKNLSKHIQVGGPFSARLRDALGMTAENSPPPWLINMQRYGPPPSYPNLKIPGLNAPIPEGCSYGYHLNGWGKPPVDAFGRPLYGGNPFDPPGSSGLISTADWDFDSKSGAIITSDGKTIERKPWGCLPFAGLDDYEDESEEEEEESDEEEEVSTADEMVESEEEGEEDENSNVESGLIRKDGMDSIVPVTPFDLRKNPGEETPAPTKQLYTVLQQTTADKEKQAGAVFTSEVTYVLPGANLPTVPEGAESVLSKAPLSGNTTKRKHDATEDDEDEADLSKKFKF